MGAGVGRSAAVQRTAAWYADFYADPATARPGLEAQLAAYQGRRPCGRPGLGPAGRDRRMTDARADAAATRREILDLVGRYARERFAPAPFDPDRDPVRYAGRVFDERELTALVDSALDFYLTASRFTEAFEAGFAEYLGLGNALFVNSGSSANLAAVTALTSPRLGDRRLQPGDEVVTVAAGFPSTVSPIVQNRLVPVFVDVRLDDYNVDPDALRAAIGPRTRAIVLAHTMGVPYDLDTVMELVTAPRPVAGRGQLRRPGQPVPGPPDGHLRARRHIVVLPGPPHHHRRGRDGGDRRRRAGGAGPLHPRLGPRLLLRGRREQHLRQAVRAAVRDAAVRLRPQVRLQPPRLQPQGHRHAGGHRRRAQLGRVDEFVAARKRNHARLREGLAPYADRLVLPAAPPNTDPSWFGFVMTVREDAGFTRGELTAYLESRRIETRSLFSGNLLRHPAFADIEHRVVGSLAVSDAITERTCFVGVYPGLDDARLDYMVDAFGRFMAGERAGGR